MTTSSDSRNGYTREETRGYAVPYALLLRSLTQRMYFRLKRCEHLIDRARAAAQDDALFAWLSALSVEWTLIENTLKVYATIARHADIRSESVLRDLNHDFYREMPDDERVEFHKRLWMFAIFDEIPDDALLRLGLDPPWTRTTINCIVERSIAHLKASENTVRALYRKYADVMNAYKHGRALFALEPKLVLPAGNRLGNFSLNATRSAATIFIAAAGPIFGTPRRIVTVRADAELINDIEESFGVLAAQVPRLAAFFDGWAAATLQYLAFLENDPAAQRPIVPMFFFGDPYSEEEERVLKVLATGNLVF